MHVLKYACTQTFYKHIYMQRNSLAWNVGLFNTFLDNLIFTKPGFGFNTLHGDHAHKTSKSIKYLKTFHLF
jgi:hypothetical protein